MFHNLANSHSCNHKKSHFSLSYGWCNNSHLGHCFASVSYCFIKDVYIWIVCKCSVWKTESKCENQTRETYWQFESTEAINNEQAKKLLSLSLFRSLPWRHAWIFFKIIKTLPKTTCRQIIKYVQVVPSFQRCSVLKFP